MRSTTEASGGVRLSLVPLRVAAFLAIMLVALSACASDGASRGSSAGGRSEAIEAEAHYLLQFETLPEMVATSDLVVQGTVVRTEPAETVSNGREELQTQDTVLRIDETLFGNASDGEVLIKELGWENGKRIAVDGVRPSEVGDTGIYFLLQDNSARFFNVINSQGRYLFVGDKLDGGNHGDPLVAEIERLSPLGLRAAIDEAKEDVQAGEVTPLPRPTECSVGGCPE